MKGSPTKNNEFREASTRRFKLTLRKVRWMFVLLVFVRAEGGVPYSV